MWQWVTDQCNRARVSWKSSLVYSQQSCKFKTSVKYPTAPLKRTTSKTEGPRERPLTSKMQCLRRVLIFWLKSPTVVILPYTPCPSSSPGKEQLKCWNYSPLKYNKGHILTQLRETEPLAKWEQQEGHRRVRENSVPRWNVGRLPSREAGIISTLQPPFIQLK